MNPDEKAKDIITNLMEYTPDYLVSDDQDAYIICCNHALILAKMVQEYSFEKSYWQDVIEIIQESIDPLTLLKNEKTHPRRQA